MHISIKCEAAKSSEECLKMLENREKCSERCFVFKNIFMDIEMPEVGGLETTKYIRKHFES